MPTRRQCGEQRRAEYLLCPNSAWLLISGFSRGFVVVDQSAEDRSTSDRELAGPIADQQPEPADVLAEIHHQVAGLLCGPRAIKMPGHAQDAQVTVADVEREQH